MFKLLLLSSAVLSSQLPNADADFRQLKARLESYGFRVTIAIPPSFDLPNQQGDFLRRTVRKPYGVLNAASKSIWINPIVFELGNSNAVLIHEAVHAAQFCAGNGNIQTIGLDIEPIKQAQPYFKRYVDVHSQAVEKEAYAVQTQPDSYELARSLLDRHCQ
ncbi:hypothetical protein IQ255_02355 [Pleurocapsales cyanobacterium LEGE 10410]|nr:hypothetical protein [Pleurocapsales cyanobacterium LEGE 10410]